MMEKLQAKEAVVEGKFNDLGFYSESGQAVKYNSPKKRFPTSVIMELQNTKNRRKETYGTFSTKGEKRKQLL